jgi:putative SOS response-associated peptidase YedK
LAVDDFSDLRVGLNLALFTPEWSRRYNIAPSHGPGHEPPFVRLAQRGSTEAGAELRLGRWWLIPFWWKKALAALPTSFNARSEDIEKKPLFREPFAQRRCLIPATGWREFPGPAGHKRAFHFHRGGPFVFAGVWDRYLGPADQIIESFAIITAEASPKVVAIHDRMPLVLPPELHAPWLTVDADRHRVLAEAVARREEQLELFEVSTYGNSVHNEGPACIARIPSQKGLFD